MLFPENLIFSRGRAEVNIGPYWDSRETKLTVSRGTSDLLYSWKSWSWKLIKPRCRRSTFADSWRSKILQCCPLRNLARNSFIVRCHVRWACGVMALGRELLSSSKVLLVLAFYHFLSTECSSIQYFYDNTSFYLAISTVTEKDSPNNVYDCPWSCGRHLVSSPRAKGFFSSRLQYYANSTCSFQQIRLFISGDISLNPGPLTRSQSA